MKALPAALVLLGGGGMLWAVVRSTSDATIYLNVEGFLIVLGGTLTATLLSFPFPDITRAWRGMRSQLRAPEPALPPLVDLFESLADTLIVKGTSGLDARLADIDDEFVRAGAALVVDQYAADKIEKVLSSTLESQRERDLIAPRVARTLGKFSPSFGMAGTLIGMIAMFQEMGTNLDGIGPAMAVAMMTTFYGLLLANLVFTPLAVKLERAVEARMLAMNLVIEGTLLLARKTPPLLLRQELATFLEPAAEQGDARP